MSSSPVKRTSREKRETGLSVRERRHSSSPSKRERFQRRHQQGKPLNLERQRLSQNRNANKNVKKKLTEKLNYLSVKNPQRMPKNHQEWERDVGPVQQTKESVSPLPLLPLIEPLTAPGLLQATISTYLEEQTLEKEGDKTCSSKKGKIDTKGTNVRTKKVKKANRTKLTPIKKPNNVFGCTITQDTLRKSKCQKSFERTRLWIDNPNTNPMNPQILEAVEKRCRSSNEIRLELEEAGKKSRCCSSSGEKVYNEGKNKRFVESISQDQRNSLSLVKSPSKNIEFNFQGTEPWMPIIHSSSPVRAKQTKQQQPQKGNTNNNPLKCIDLKKVVKHADKESKRKISCFSPVGFPIGDKDNIKGSTPSTSKVKVIKNLYDEKRESLLDNSNTNPIDPVSLGTHIGVEEGIENMVQIDSDVLNNTNTGNGLIKESSGIPERRSSLKSEKLADSRSTERLSRLIQKAMSFEEISKKCSSNVSIDRNMNKNVSYTTKKKEIPKRMEAIELESHPDSQLSLITDLLETHNWSKVLAAKTPDEKAEIFFDEVMRKVDKAEPINIRQRRCSSSPMKESIRHRRQSFSPSKTPQAKKTSCYSSRQNIQCTQKKVFPNPLNTIKNQSKVKIRTIPSFMPKIVRIQTPATPINKTEKQKDQVISSSDATSSDITNQLNTPFNNQIDLSAPTISASKKTAPLSQHPSGERVCQSLLEVPIRKRSGSGLQIEEPNNYMQVM